MTTTDELREAVARVVAAEGCEAETAPCLPEQVEDGLLSCGCRYAADRIIRMVVDACAERAADFVWLRLYRGGGDRALPVMSFHSQEIAAVVRALAPKEPAP